MKNIRVLLAVVIAAALAFGFATTSRAQDAASTLRIGFAQEPDNMNDFLSNMSFAKWANDLAFATLWDYDSTGTKPVLTLGAEVPSVENKGISADLKTYTVKLKADLKWSDGKPLTSEDVAFTFEMIKAYKANEFIQGGPIGDVLDKVEVVDPVTVKLTFTEAKPFPESILSATGLSYVLPAHIYKPYFEANKSLKGIEEAQNPTVFSGPYVLKEWKRGEAMTFEANSNYVLGTPKIKTVVIRFFENPETAFAALAAGQLDWVPNLGPVDAPKVKALSPDIETVGVFGGFIEFIDLNLRSEEGYAGNPALRDLKVRQALRLGIDRRAIVKDLLADVTTVTDSLYAGSAFENKKLGFVEYDAAAAEKLLDEAGWKKGADGVREKDGAKLELRYLTTTAAWRKDIQAVVQQQLAKIGVKIVLDNKPASEYFGSFADSGTLATGQYDFGEFANSTTLTNIVNDSVDQTFACAQLVSEKNPGGSNYSGYCNEEMDKLSTVTKTSTDAAERQAAADKIQEIMRDEVPMIVLFPRGDIYAYSKARFVTAPNIGSGQGGIWYDIVNWEVK